MKHVTHFILGIFLSGFLFPVNAQKIVKDREGNIYKTVQVGTQVWMAENLKATRFQNGDPIPVVSAAKEWNILKTPACCDLNNNADDTKKHGRIYNWYAAADERNVCPAGWHVPDDAEWATLTNTLSGEKGSGGVLQGMADLNKKVFPVLPEGFRGWDGEFSGIGYGGGGWWSATSCTPESAFYRNVTYNTAGRVRMEGLKSYGYNIRCVKD